MNTVDGVTIKGTRDGLMVTLGSGSLSALLEELSARLAEKAGFFEGARVIVQAGERSLALPDLTALQSVMSQHNMMLWAVIGDAEDTRTLARQLGLATRLPSAAAANGTSRASELPAPGSVPAFMRGTAGGAAGGAAGGSTMAAPDEEGGDAAGDDAIATAPAAPVPTAPVAPVLTAPVAPALPADLAAPTVPFVDEGVAGLFVRRTLRSGKSLRYAGAVVVLGDVNPGAEVIAGGDVVVWGKLRGMVHAGAMGDEHAVVCALDMVPMQLRIAGHIAIAPEDARKRRATAPEMARVQDGQIVVEGWNPK